MRGEEEGVDREGEMFNILVLRGFFDFWVEGVVVVILVNI